MRVDRHVQRRQIREVPHDVRLGQLGQRQAERRPRPPAGSSSASGATARREPETARRRDQAWKVRTAVQWHGCYALIGFAHERMKVIAIATVELTVSIEPCLDCLCLAIR